MADDIRDKLKAKVALLPTTPGVYRFIGKGGEVIYVGKAKNLRRRVSSYFIDRADLHPKVRVMVSRAVDLEHIVVATEADAFLLENNLIKQLKPRYNILLKDDKTYPWIVVRNEPFPRVMSTRRMERDGSVYFGPYASVQMQKTVLELIHSVYPIRTCALNLAPEMIAKGRYAVCLEYHIGNCKGPCVGNQSAAEYAEQIEQVKAVLRGDLRATRADLTRRMHEAAAAMKFELAQTYKQKLELLNDYHSKSVIVSSTLSDLDVFGLVVDDDAAYCNFTRIVSGAVVNSFTVELKLGMEQTEADILTYAIGRIAERVEGGLSHEVVVPVLPAQELWPAVRFVVPQRGEKVKLLDFAVKSAKIYRLEKLKNLEIKDPARHSERIVARLQKDLRLPAPPRHIECFDNSNLQGTHPVASCVVFRDGKPSRKEYRHFNIKTVVGPDDFASMREIIGRRYSRLLSEGAELPDLIVVDGGKGQLSSAYSVLVELGLEHRIPIIGLAKRIEEVFYPHDPEPYYLDRNSESLRVIMHLRDEAHRFGITFHRKKRSLAFIKSELEAIPGLGTVSVEKLLRKFKTISAIKRATVEELAEVIGAHRASEVIKFYADAPDNNAES